MSSDSGFIANGEGSSEHSGADDQRDMAEALRLLRQELREMKAFLEWMIAVIQSERLTPRGDGRRPASAPARQEVDVQWLRADLALNRLQRRIEFYDNAGRMLKRRTLPATHAALLTILADTPQRAHSREELAERVGVTPHTVSKDIGRLRALCEDNDCTLIQTKRGKGYALCLLA